MSVVHLGFVFLLLFPGLLHAVRIPPCPAPSLNDGLFHPNKETYLDKEVLSYACDSGYKPVVEGWWATCKCQNGKWSHVPQCIDERSCLPPTVSNGKYPESQNGWYEDNHRITITCDDGYELTSFVSGASCRDGKWSSLPNCEKSSSACDEPPQVQHATIINVGYKEVFAENEEVQYECEEGYFTQEGGTKKSVTCSSGSWTGGPTCRAASSSGSAGSSGPMIRTEVCGRIPPAIQNGVIVQRSPFSLTYQCNQFYKLVGVETVVCYSDGSWSPLPVCQDAFCVLDPALYSELKLSATQFIKEGASLDVPCQDRYLTAVVECTNNALQVSKCCSSYDRYWNYC